MEIEKFLLSAIKNICKHDKWKKTTPKEEVPKLFHEYNIDTGYRLVGQSWTYYFLSFFWLHNESMNVWTHFFGGLAIIVEMVRFVVDYGQVSVLATQLMMIFGASAVLLQMMSALAHLLHNKNEFVHCSCFYCDNATASHMAFSANLILFCFYSLPEYHRVMLPYFLPVQFVGCLAVSFTYSYALARYRRKYNAWTRVLMFGPTAAYFLWGMVPFFHKVYASLWLGMDDIDFKYRYLIHILLFLVAVFFYASYLPEKMKKGGFDIFGHSHQLFHAMYSISLLTIFWAVRHDISQNTLWLAADIHTVIDIRNVYISLMILCVLNVGIVLGLVFGFTYDTKQKTS